MLVRIEPLKSFIAARSLLRFYRHDNYSDAAGGQTSTRWLLPFEPDASAYRLGSEVGPTVFAQQSQAWKACPRGVLLQAVQTANQPDMNKQCLPLEYGMAAATGRSLKVSLPEMKGFTPSRFYPELVVIGQFGKVFYLWQE